MKFVFCWRMIRPNRSYNIQGRDFGLKSGGTDSEGERSALGCRDEGRRERSIPFSLDFGIWESSLSGFRGWAPAEDGFIVI